MWHTGFPCCLAINFYVYYFYFHFVNIFRLNILIKYKKNIWMSSSMLLFVQEVGWWHQMMVTNWIRTRLSQNISCQRLFQNIRRNLTRFSETNQTACGLRGRLHQNSDLWLFHSICKHARNKNVKHNFCKLFKIKSCCSNKIIPYFIQGHYELRHLPIRFHNCFPNSLIWGFMLS